MDLQWFKNQFDEVGKPHKDLAKMIGRDRSVIGQFLAGGRKKFPIDWIEPFANFLEVPQTEVALRAGLSTEIVRPGSFDLADEIKDFTSEELEDLRSYARYLRSKRGIS